MSNTQSETNKLFAEIKKTANKILPFEYKDLKSVDKFYQDDPDRAVAKVTIEDDQNKKQVFVLEIANKRVTKDNKTITVVNAVYDSKLKKHQGKHPEEVFWLTAKKQTDTMIKTKQGLN